MADDVDSADGWGSSSSDPPDTGESGDADSAEGWGESSSDPPETGEPGDADSAENWGTSDPVDYDDSGGSDDTSSSGSDGGSTSPDSSPQDSTDGGSDLNTVEPGPPQMPQDGGSGTDTDTDTGSSSGSGGRAESDSSSSDPPSTGEPGDVDSAEGWGESSPDPPETGEPGDADSAEGWGNPQLTREQAAASIAQDVEGVSQDDLTFVDGELSKGSQEKLGRAALEESLGQQTAQDLQLGADFTYDEASGTAELTPYGQQELVRSQVEENNLGNLEAGEDFQVTYNSDATGNASGDGESGESPVEVSLTESGQEAVAQAQQERRAAAVAVTSGSGELARGIDATDFGAFDDAISRVEQAVEEQNPGMDAGEDFTVGINEAGEFTATQTDQYEQEQAERQSDIVEQQYESRLEEQTGADLSSDDVTSRTVMEDGETRVVGELTRSGQQKVENSMEPSTTGGNENVTGLAGIVGLDAQTVRDINEASQNVLNTVFTGDGYGDSGLPGPELRLPGGEGALFGTITSEDGGSVNTDVTDALTQSGGLLTESQEQDLRVRANRLSDEYAFIGDTLQDTVSGATGSEEAGRFAGSFGDVVGNLPANVDRGILAAETGVETVQNSPDVGVEDTLAAVGSVTGALTKQTVQSAQQNPYQFAGEIVGGAALGTATFKGIEKAGDVRRSATLSTDGEVDYSEITDEHGAQGDLPQFETAPEAPTREAVREVSERAADQPEAVSEVGEFGIPEAIGFRMGELTAPRVRTVKEVINQPLSAGESLGYRAGTQTRSTIQTVEDAVSQDFETFSMPSPSSSRPTQRITEPAGDLVESSQRRATTARDIVGRPLDAAEDAGFRAGESVGRGVQAGQNLVDQPLSAGESLGFRVGESVGRGVQAGQNLVDQPLSVAEEAGYHAGESVRHGLSGSAFAERARSQLQTVDEMVFDPAEELGRGVGESIGKSISDIESRRDNPRPLSSVLYHGTQAEFDADFEVGEGASELPGLFTSPDASPIALQGSGTGWPSPTLKPSLPSLGGKSDRFVGLPGDDVRGMPEDATGAGYAVKEGDDVVESGLGRGEAKAKASDMEDAEVAPDPTTSGYEFLTEGAEPDAAYVRPEGGRTTELESIFPPESEFTKTGTIGVRVGRKQIPGTDVDIPGTGRKVPLDLFERSGETTADSSPGGSLEDLSEGGSTTAAAVSRDLDRLGEDDGSVAAGGAYTGGAAASPFAGTSADNPDSAATGESNEGTPGYGSSELSRDERDQSLTSPFDLEETETEVVSGDTTGPFSGTTTVEGGSNGTDEWTSFGEDTVGSSTEGTSETTSEPLVDPSGGGGSGFGGDYGESVGTVFGDPTEPTSGGPTEPTSGGPTEPTSGGPTEPTSGGPTEPTSGGPTSPPSGGPTSPPSGGPTSTPFEDPTEPTSGGPILPRINLDDEGDNEEEGDFNTAFSSDTFDTGIANVEELETQMQDVEEQFDDLPF